MHASNRKLDIGSSKYLLKDAGLNTYAYSRAVVDTNTVSWANMFSVRLYLKSSYFEITSTIGYEYKISAGSWTNGGSTVVNLAANGAMYVEFREQDKGGAYGNTIYFRAYAINPEGTRGRH